MVDPHFNVVAHVDAMSALSGLELDAESRTAVIANLTRLHRFACLMAVASQQDGDRFGHEGTTLDGQSGLRA